MRRFIVGAAGKAQPPQFGGHNDIFQHALWLVRIYYVANILLVYQALPRIRRAGLSSDDLDAVWPVRWIEFVGSEFGSLLILHLSILAGVAALFLWRYRIVRILVCVSWLEIGALANSFGAINHSYHEWIWIAFCLVFLPDGTISEIEKSRTNRMRYLTVIVLIQGLILFFYSLSGLYKVGFATAALLGGDVGGFSPDAMALTLANRMLQTGSDAIWAPIIIQNPLLGWPLYLGLYYVELVAILVLFRPALHRSWGLVLILFHFGTYLFMEISFPTHVLINAMFFVLSPFAPPRFVWREVLAAIPGIRLLIRMYENVCRNAKRADVARPTAARTGIG